MPSGDLSLDVFVYELRFKFLQDLLSRNPSVCYDLDTLENLLIGGIKPLPTPVPTPGPNIRIPNSTPTPTPSPTPVPVSTPVGPVPTPTPKETPEERKKRLKKLLDERFPEGDEVEKRVQEIKKKNKPSEPRDDIKWKLVDGDFRIDGFIGVEIQLPGVGKIEVTLPEDHYYGDILTGSVTVEPDGKTEEERKKNKVELAKYGVEIFAPSTDEISRSEPFLLRPFMEGFFSDDRTSAQIAPSWEIQWEETADAERAAITLSVTRNDDKTKIPIEVSQFNIKREQLPNVPEILTSRVISPYIQTGSRVKITGKFDGIGGNTKLQTGGKDLRIVAESPRSCLFRVPADLIGPGEITIKENGKEQKLPFRSIGVGLSAPKLNLKRGEKTTVTIEVTGLKGLRENEIVPLQLVSSGVVDMKGGNSQSLQIRKKDIDKDGIYRTTRTVTGQSTGGWGVRATVIDPHR